MVFILIFSFLFSMNIFSVSFGIICQCYFIIDVPQLIMGSCWWTHCNLSLSEKYASYSQQTAYYSLIYKDHCCILSALMIPWMHGGYGLLLLSISLTQEKTNIQNLKYGFYKMCIAFILPLGLKAISWIIFKLTINFMSNMLALTCNQTIYLFKIFYYHIHKNCFASTCVVYRINIFISIIIK